jgi:4-amino-4-deoxy-L-arabinose transferase-like glycosyltransferase
MTAAPEGGRASTRSFLLVAALLVAFIFASHVPFLTVPFYWDELGQFVPAALDIFQKGEWVPRSTVPNVHPPGVMAYLAAVWSVTGFSIAATRLAMLVLAAVGAVATLRLAICMGLSMEAGALAAGFLSVSPLFFSQSMMAQLDMPAMVFLVLALLLFLEERIVAAALASVALVMIKETGIVAPALFGAWLWRERRRREAMWFVAPVVPLVAWLLVLERATGRLFGNAAFTQYNVWYPLHPVRLPLALMRRLYYLFIGTGHWIGSVALVPVLRERPVFRTRAWRIAGLLVAGHVVLVSALGGAVLERYLLPVLPILYIGFVAGLWRYGKRWRIAGAAGLGAALIAGNFVNPPYPFPLENNLAFVDFVKLHAEAAGYLEARPPNGKIATMFPLASALRRPEYGYVRRRLSVREIYDFSARNVAPLAHDDVAALVLYSTAWDPLGLMENPKWTAFIKRYYGYEPPVGAEEIRVLLGAHRVARWTRHGQWIEIYER